MAQDGRRLCLLDGFVATSRAGRMLTVTRLFMALVTACAVSLFAHGRSCADARVALVIGNGAYSHEPVLKNLAQRRKRHGRRVAGTWISGNRGYRR